MRAVGPRPLSESRPIEKLPQRLENVAVPSREALSDATDLWEAVGREGAGLEGRGRVLVRPSGTEPLVRVMVEAPDEEECEEVLARLVEVANRALG
jgi:phosphoglucosamine mutase